MKAVYRIFLMGDTSVFDKKIRSALQEHLKLFDLKFGNEIELLHSTDYFDKDNRIATVGLFFGAEPAPKFLPNHALQAHHPIIPIVTKLNRCGVELPNDISHFNAIASEDSNAPNSISAVILECLGLIPTSRRIFLSYRRIESQEIALQLFDELSARQFDVFLDTHEIRPGTVFQDVLWHNLSQSDVMLMLDTDSYFQSRWTKEEYGKANLKMASILRIAWPNVERDSNLSVTESMLLDKANFDKNMLLTKISLDSIADAVERLRSISISIREANLIGTYRAAVEQLNGSVELPGTFRRIVTSFPCGKQIIVYPAVGVPNSEIVNSIANDAMESEFGLLYDHVGILRKWLTHLDWLGGKISCFRWIRAESSALILKRFIEDGK